MKKKRAVTIFVGGTDTGVGKTYVSQLLLKLALKRGLSAAYYKPLSTGADVSEDLAFIEQSVKGVYAKTGAHFPFPASPHFAAELAGKAVQLEKLDQDLAACLQKGAWTVVEGIGGLFVPIQRTPPLYLLDLIARWKLPVLLVARAGLGTLNHTLLSLSALKARGVPCLALACNQGRTPRDGTEEDNGKTLAELTKLPVFHLSQDASFSTDDEEKLWKIVAES